MKERTGHRLRTLQPYLLAGERAGTPSLTPRPRPHQPQHLHVAFHAEAEGAVLRFQLHRQHLACRPSSSTSPSVPLLSGSLCQASRRSCNGHWGLEPPLKASRPRGAHAQVTSGRTWVHGAATPTLSAATYWWPPLCGKPVFARSVSSDLEGSQAGQLLPTP